MFDTKIMVNYTKLSDITAFRRMSFIHNRIIDIDCPGSRDILWRWIVWIAHPSRFEDINFVSEVAGKWLKNISGHLLFALFSV